MSGMSVPADYYPRVMHAISLLGQGHTLTAACDAAGVTVSTLHATCRATPELQELYNDAEQRGYDRMADILLTIDTDPLYGTTDPRKMKIVSDNIKWYLSRKRPQQYGERVVVETNITADRAIIDALERGRQRALTARVIEDVAYEVIDDAVVNAIEHVPQKTMPSTLLNVDDTEDVSQFL